MAKNRNIRRNILISVKRIPFGLMIFLNLAKVSSVLSMVDILLNVTILPVTILSISKPTFLISTRLYSRATSASVRTLSYDRKQFLRVCDKEYTDD